MSGRVPRHPGATPSRAHRAGDPRTFVVVGASLAGARAAETLREDGFDGRVVLIGAEPDRPYERPPLSKEHLRGDGTREKLFVHPPDFAAEHDIEQRLGTTVTAIDPDGHRVLLDDGETIPYGRLLLATGSEPRRLDAPGADLAGVHVLRTLADGDRLAAALRGAPRVVVVGGGWIGCEVAASARSLGCEVAMVDHAPVPLARVLGPEVGARFRDLHAGHGVALHLGASVSALLGRDTVEAVELGDGRRIDADVVVVGIGARPRVELALAAGIETGNGIHVDEHLHTSAPDVFAAGDVAAAIHPLLGARIRVDHWANALHQGPAAARSMLGVARSYDRIPYFFSDQYDLGMEYAGHAPHWDRVVLRGDPAEGRYLAFWLDGGRVAAGMNVNVWDVQDHIQALVRRRATPEPARLADPSVPLEDLALG